MMGMAPGKKRAYSPRTVERWRKPSASASDFDAVIATDLTKEGAVGPPDRTVSRKKVQGLAEKDIAELRERKKRAANARYRAKARRGRLVFK